MRLKGKVAIVTGGGGGIGRATCLTLARQGATIMIADVVLSTAESVARELKAEGYVAQAMNVDIAKYEEAEGLAGVTVKQFGRIDILVNIAGGSAGPAIKTQPSLFAFSAPGRWDEMITLNLKGTLNCTRAVINYMIEQNGGRIISLASTAGVIGALRVADYSAAKAGVIGFTKALAKEVASHGINVNSISPGVVGTPRMLGMPKEMLDGYLKGIRLKRLASPDEIASVILFLASSDSSYITGQNINVDGGLTLGPEDY